MKQDELPFFTLVMPVLNEQAYILAALQSLLAQIPEKGCEVLVLDGGSSDATLGIVESIRRSQPVVRVIHNPGRIQSVALNLAARMASAESTVLIRADAHAVYPPDFLQRCLRALQHNAATSVVVPMRTVGTSRLQRAVAATQNSRLGNGGSAHRVRCVSGFVEHGHHAAFDLGFFRKINGYDETFTHNEDAEHDIRAIQAGGRVWLCAEASIDYFPRKRLSDIARQYCRHGRGRARTVLTHNLRLRPRQLAPLAILILFAATLGAPVSPAMALPAALYIALCLSWGGIAAVMRRDLALVAMGPAAIVMHLSWAVGFVDQFAKLWLARATRRTGPGLDDEYRPTKGLAEPRRGS